MDEKLNELADKFAAAPFVAQGTPKSIPCERSSEPIVIGENSWVGARAVILSGARIGEGAIIGAAAVVDFEVPPGAIVAGNPARIVGWVHEHEK